MKYVFIESGTATSKVVDIDGELKDFYRLIGCECITMIRRKFGDSYYDIIADDEALLKNDSLPVAITFDDNGHTIEYLFGNILVTKTDGEGCDVSLTDEDISLITDKGLLLNALTMDQRRVKVLSLKL